jgi:UPF0755 protein
MKRFLLVFFALLVLAGTAGFVLIGRELYRPYRNHSEDVVLIIEPGTHAQDTANILVERGVLAHRLPFLLRYLVGRTRHRLKAGEYLFDRPLSPFDVYQKLVRGDVYLYTVMIPEGSDRFDIAGILNQALKIDPQEFLHLTAKATLIRDLDPRAPTLEGYLFPDTYRFPRGVTAATVVETMLLRFRRLIDAKLSPDLEPRGARLHDVVTLASLVEKETPDPLERPMVAGVFARRLQIGMPLACDPTVVYAARLNHRMLEHPLPPIRRSDLIFDSPYNTYLRPGLPPGPIANPGEASIRGALAPAPGNALYFVSNNHRGHLFAATLTEHVRNVAMYRKHLAELRTLDVEGVGHATPKAAGGLASGRAPKRSTKRDRLKKQETTHSGIPRRPRARSSGRA